LLTARRENALRELAAECGKLGPTPEILAGDVTDPEVRAALVARAEALWTGLDVLINNAGVSAHGTFATSDEQTLRRVMEVNFFAPAELTRAALPLLRRARGAAVVNVCSIIGHRGLPFASEYAASKFALRGWSEALRAELAGQRIDVVLVSPGTTDTGFFDHLIAQRAAPPWQGSKPVPASVVASQTLRALQRGRREIYPNWRGRALVAANRWFPGLVDRVVKRLGRRSE
jgi:short-subunit dehydrogenase